MSMQIRIRSVSSEITCSVRKEEKHFERERCKMKIYIGDQECMVASQAPVMESTRTTDDSMISVQSVYEYEYNLFLNVMQIKTPCMYFIVLLLDKTDQIM